MTPLATILFAIVLVLYVRRLWLDTPTARAWLAKYDREEREAAEAARLEASRNTLSELLDAVERVVRRYEHFAHYEDRAFLNWYARANLESLLRDRDTILKEHAALFRERRLMSYLEAVSPATYRRVQWRTHALALAEQFAVEPTPVSARALPPPRQKETPDEYDARQARHEKRKVQRAARRARARLEALQEAEQDLSRVVPDPERSGT
jgi:hypothetical protein